jgi:hypothetical protein
MDIGEFYDRDENRRTSTEVEFGTEWLDHNGVRFELSWVENTRELYVMREPAPPGWEDPFGGIHTERLEKAPVDGMEVVILGVLDRADLERILAGWEAEVGKPGSVHWLIECLDQAGVLTPVAKEEGPE